MNEVGSCARGEPWARGSGSARAAVHARAVGQPVAPLGPAWAVLGISWHMLHCHPVVTCAARLSTGTGVSAWGVLGGQLAAGASPRSRRCAVTIMLCSVTTKTATTVVRHAAKLVRNMF